MKRAPILLLVSIASIGARGRVSKPAPPDHLPSRYIPAGACSYRRQDFSALLGDWNARLKKPVG